MSDKKNDAKWEAAKFLPYRQRETLEGLARGLTSQQMADEAGVTKSVIESAKKTLAHRMRLPTAKATRIVSEAIKRGWVKALMLMLSTSIALAPYDHVERTYKSQRLAARIYRACTVRLAA